MKVLQWHSRYHHRILFFIICLDPDSASIILGEKEVIMRIDFGIVAEVGFECGAVEDWKNLLYVYGIVWVIDWLRDILNSRQHGSET
ncbi:hypothetical protein BKA57DRAFT_460705 [Linnemannia elongata]|nr:hypothetical protein BKA57DRAFT_460705 [Linnemannia elongata]